MFHSISVCFKYKKQGAKKLGLLDLDRPPPLFQTKAKSPKAKIILTPSLNVEDDDDNNADTKIDNDEKEEDGNAVMMEMMMRLLMMKVMLMMVVR